MRVSLVLVVALAALAGGCGSSGNLDRTGTHVQVADALPAPDLVALTSAQREYRIGPFDTITVDVFGVEALSREGMVDASGSFGVPLIGQVQASGLTTAQFASSIADRLRGRYVRDPQVSVNVREVRSQRVTVDGAVNTPGIYPVVGRMTLQQAIATARGTSEYARLSRVAVFRTVNNQRMAALFDLREIREGRAPDPEIFGNDIVVVGDNALRRIFRDALSTIPVLGVFAAF